jgi:hypothetical protein
MNETIWLVACYKFKDDRAYGFERIHLHWIFKTEELARRACEKCFCDEAGWYEGTLIEERSFGYGSSRNLKRIWYRQEDHGVMEEIEEPKGYKNICNLIG